MITTADETTAEAMELVVDDRVAEVSIDLPDSPKQPVCKKQKKKRTNRPPLCTFFNYLGDPAASSSEPTLSTEPCSEETLGDTTTPMVVEEEEKDIVPPEEEEVGDAGIETMITTRLSSLTCHHRNATDANVAEDSESVETVNTSNKSVDLYLRDTTELKPAADRWKKPPPPEKKKIDIDALFDGGFYITSRCESDEESDSPEPAKPREIVVRNRGRCPRLHRWQKKLPTRRNHRRSTTGTTMTTTTAAFR